MNAEYQAELALANMTNHEFLNAKRTRERTTFSDGTTVTVDWDANTVDVQPELQVGK